MPDNFRMVRSVRGSLPDVWAAILRARTFVVPPHRSFGVKLLRDAELRSGESVFAKLAVGPMVLPDRWVVETHDRDNQQVALRGAEGFEHRLLWDHEVLIGEAGPRCIVEYRVHVPGRRSILDWGIGVQRVCERRHLSLRSILEDALAPGIARKLSVSGEITKLTPDICSAEFDAGVVF